MTQLAEKLHPWVASTRPSGGPRWLVDLRERAAARFTALGFPTVREEEWRFTNVSPVVSREYATAVTAAPVTPAQIEGLPFGSATHRVVVVNGRFSSEHSRLKGLPAGVRAGSLGGYVTGELQSDSEFVQRLVQLPEVAGARFAVDAIANASEEIARSLQERIQHETRAA